MNELTHLNPQATLPPPKHVRVVERTPQPLSRADLWETIEGLSRVLTEMSRRGIAHDLFSKVDVARSVVLALYSTAEPEPGHSVKIRVVPRD